MVGIRKFAHILGFILDSFRLAPYSTAHTVRNPFHCAQLSRWVTSTHLRSFCTVVASLPERASLRSSTCCLMVIPRNPRALPMLSHSLRQELLSLSTLQLRKRLSTDPGWDCCWAMSDVNLVWKRGRVIPKNSTNRGTYTTGLNVSSPEFLI